MLYYESKGVLGTDDMPICWLYDIRDIWPERLYGAAVNFVCHPSIPDSKKLDKGKPSERVGRKTMGSKAALQQRAAMIARSPMFHYYL